MSSITVHEKYKVGAKGKIMEMAVLMVTVMGLFVRDMLQ